MNTNAFQTVLDRYFKMNQDYLFDHVLDLFEEEKKLEVVPNYYETVQELEVTPKMRTKLIEWMIQLADEIKLQYKTKQMAVIIVDLILSKLKIHKKFLQLLGITAIFISIKSEESFIYTLKNACDHCANSYTSAHVSEMEMLILKTLKWKLQYPTPGEIARRLVQLANSALQVDMSRFFKKTDNFIDLAISEFDTAVFSPTCIAIASVMCTFENSLEHIQLWRNIIVENFHFDFTIIDDLYQKIVQKLAVFFPDYVNNSQQISNCQESPSMVEQEQIMHQDQLMVSDSSQNAYGYEQYNHMMDASQMMGEGQIQMGYNSNQMGFNPNQMQEEN
jgi:hypothetical protein